MSRVNLAHKLRINTYTRFSSLLLKRVCVFILLCICHYTIARADECQTLLPTYQESLLRFQDAQKLYLGAGCFELSERDMSHTEEPQVLKCKKLRMGLQEIQSVTHMLGLRLKAKSCKHMPRKLSTCDRFKVMIEKADQEVKELNRQRKAQHCQRRSYTPPCQALRKAQKKPLGLLKAAKRSWRESQCHLKSKRAHENQPH